MKMKIMSRIQPTFKNLILVNDYSYHGKIMLKR